MMLVASGIVTQELPSSEFWRSREKNAVLGDIMMFNVSSVGGSGPLCDAS